MEAVPGEMKKWWLGGINNVRLGNYNDKTVITLMEYNNSKGM